MMTLLQDYPAAERLQRRMLAIRRSYVPARLGLAWSLYYQGRLEEAKGEFDHALWWTQVLSDADDPKRRYPLHLMLYELGKFYKVTGDWRQAERNFREATAADPTFANGHWELGRLLRDRGQMGPALLALQQARRHLPEDAPVEEREELEREIAELTHHN
jgi:tetratricopeptide (TPR) repeat protein